MCAASLDRAMGIIARGEKFVNPFYHFKPHIPPHIFPHISPIGSLFGLSPHSILVPQNLGLLLISYTYKKKYKY